MGTFPEWAARDPYHYHGFLMMGGGLSQHQGRETNGGHVAELVGIEGGVVSGVINLESSGA
jgi:hypothetical protein